MRIRIIIDTQDASDPGAADEPFTLNVYQDDEDGTQSRAPLEIKGHGSALIGGRIDVMLKNLAKCWATNQLTDHEDVPIPVDTASWRASLEPRTPAQVADIVMGDAYGSGSEWDCPNQFDERGFTRAQAESDINTEDILDLIQKAIEWDRAERPQQSNADQKPSEATGPASNDQSPAPEPSNQPTPGRASTPRLVLDSELIYTWTGQRPSHEQMRRLANQLPDSEVPDAISNIVNDIHFDEGNPHER